MTAAHIDAIYAHLAECWRLTALALATLLEGKRA